MLRAAAKASPVTALICPYFSVTATLALINRDQLSLLYIKLLLLHHLPLVEATATQGFAFVLLRGRRPFELNNLTHSPTSPVSASIQAYPIIVHSSQNGTDTNTMPETGVRRQINDALIWRAV